MQRRKRRLRQRWIVPRIIITLLSIVCTAPCWGGEVRFFSFPCEEAFRSPRLDSENYELTVAQSYLNWRHDANEDILLASQIDGWHTPAFDGVVEDPTGKKIANLSIKGIRVVATKRQQVISSDKVASSIEQAVKSAARMSQIWSEEARWDSWMKYTRAELNELIARNPFETLLRRKRLLITAMDLFSIPLSRSGLRTRIVVAITDASGQLQEATEEQIPSQTIKNICEETSCPVESITILSKNQVWNFAN